MVKPSRWPSILKVVSVHDLNGSLPLQMLNVRPLHASSPCSSVQCESDIKIVARPEFLGYRSGKVSGDLSSGEDQACRASMPQQSLKISKRIVPLRAVEINHTRQLPIMHDEMARMVVTVLESGGDLFHRAELLVDVVLNLALPVESNISRQTSVTGRGISFCLNRNINQALLQWLHEPP